MGIRRLASITERSTQTKSPDPVVSAARRVIQQWEMLELDDNDQFNTALGTLRWALDAFDGHPAPECLCAETAFRDCQLHS